MPADAVFFDRGKWAKVLPGIFQGFLGVCKAMKFAIPGPGSTPVIKEIVMEQGSPDQLLKVSVQS